MGRSHSSNRKRNACGLGVRSARLPLGSVKVLFLGRDKSATLYQLWTRELMILQPAANGWGLHLRNFFERQALGQRLPRLRNRAVVVLTPHRLRESKTSVDTVLRQSDPFSTERRGTGEGVLRFV